MPGKLGLFSQKALADVMDHCIEQMKGLQILLHTQTASFYLILQNMGPVSALPTKQFIFINSII